MHGPDEGGGVILPVRLPFFRRSALQHDVRLRADCISRTQLGRPFPDGGYRSPGPRPGRPHRGSGVGGGAPNRGIADYVGEWPSDRCTPWRRHAPRSRHRRIQCRRGVDLQVPRRSRGSPTLDGSRGNAVRDQFAQPLAVVGGFVAIATAGPPRPGCSSLGPRADPRWPGRPRGSAVAFRAWPWSVIASTP